jgi:hypothetical protein
VTTSKIGNETDDIVMSDNTSLTSTPDKILELNAFELHARAAANLAHVLAHLRIKNPPTLRDLYLGLVTTVHDPTHLNFHILFKQFDDLAQANFVAHPSPNIIKNGLIWHYSMDKEHSWNMSLEQSRFHFILGIFAWGSQLTSRCDPNFDDTKHI